MDENTNEASISFPSIVNVTNVTTAVMTGIEKNMKRFTAIRRSVARIRSSSTARSAAIRSSIDCSQVYLPRPKTGCEHISHCSTDIRNWSMMHAQFDDSDPKNSFVGLLDTVIRLVQLRRAHFVQTHHHPLVDH